MWGVPHWIWTHPANEGHRTRSLLRGADFQFRGRVLRRPMKVPVGRTGVLEANLHSSGGSKAVYANPPDWPEMIIWQQRLREGDLFVDVGANVGVYSLWAGDLGAEVIALEPNPVAAARLRRNAELSGMSIEIIEAAASSESGTASFDPTGDTTGHLGEGSLLVRTVTIDEVIGDRIVAGMKVDVEGFERLVLEGATRALAEKRIRCIQLEWNSASVRVLGEDREPVAALLRETGYTLHHPDQDAALHVLPTAGFGADVFALPIDDR